MKIRRSFRFVFKTKGALGKLFRGGLYTCLFFTVFSAFVVMGYLMRLMCELLEGRDTKLPEWRNQSDLFNDGLQPVLVSLVYLSPVIALSILGLYIQVGYIYVIQGFLTLVVSGILPLALIHFVTARSIRAAFGFDIIVSFMRQNIRLVLRAWLVNVGLSLGTALIAVLISLLFAVPLSLLTDVKTGAAIGFGFGAVAFCFELFAVTAIATHVWSQMYRESTSFADDSEGRIRSSIVVPPSLQQSREN